MKRHFVWDLPTRVFHWTLVVLVGVSFTTGLMGGFNIMDYHMLSGYGILSLVIFRILWGVIGNDQARFSSFVKGPKTTIAYAKQLLKKHQQPSTGHNPLGALSVLAMLAVLLIQAGSGLFANDDILLEGPLVHLVSDRTSSQLTSIHETVPWIIAGLVILHLAALAYHVIIRGENLLLPMLTGWRQSARADKKASNPWFRGLLAFGVVALGVYALVNYV
ncbi:MAG: cytochrome b/b6 domain-containing protein [SAR86 cluster bacterium]|jgi:cytochrome b|tara:strand:+ start:2399 stop:3055 length:657 start_codon:yes stop_codon:yes gene_type:complete